MFDVFLFSLSLDYCPSMLLLCNGIVQFNFYLQNNIRYSNYCRTYLLIYPANFIFLVVDGILIIKFVV